MRPYQKIALAGALLIAIIWYGPTIWDLIKPRTANPLPIAQTSSQPSSQSDSFLYPALSINAPLTISQNTNPTVTSDWSKFRDALTKGVSLSFDANSFQNASLVFIVGHSSDSYPHPFSTIFAPLTKGQVGDIVELTLDKTTYQFKIIDRQIIGPTDVAKFMSYVSPDPSIQRLEVVTCYPVFTSAKRLTLIAERTR